MKRLFFTLLLFVGFSGFVFAQTGVKVSATSFTLSNTDKGIRQASPEMVLWNASDMTVATTIAYFLYNPDGSLVSKSGVNSSQDEVQLRPGQNKVTLPSLTNCPTSLFTEGTYSYKVNVNGETVCQGTIAFGKQTAPTITPQPAEPVVTVQQPVAPQPQVEEEPVAEQPKMEQPVTNNDQPTPRVKEPKAKPEPMKFHFGINGGATFSSFKLAADGQMSSAVDYILTSVDDFYGLEKPNYQFNPGFNAGLFVQIPLLKGKNLFLETGAQFSHTSYTNRFRSSDFSTDESSLWISFDDAEFNMDYGCKENYTLNAINVPVMFGYEFAISKLFHIDLKTGPVLNVIATVNLTMSDFYSNCDVYTYLEDGSWGYYGSASSNITGSANLMTGTYEYTQKFTTGDGGSYQLSNFVDPVPVYKRINASWRIGANIGVGPVALEVAYDLGLTNMANKAYWENTDGARIPGLILFGDSFYSETPINGYSQKLGVLTAGLSVRF